MQLEQLSIFESINYFQPSKAHWRKWIDNANVTYVMAIIPEDALSPVEHWLEGSRLSMFSKEYQDQLDHWGHHKDAIIWALDRCDRDKAGEILEHHRETKEPVKMMIEEDFKDHFERTEIVEYLKGAETHVS